MDLRDFFSEAEIRAMKARIVRETSLNYFLAERKYVDEDGVEETYKALAPDIQREIKSIIDNEVKAFIQTEVKRILHEIVTEKVAKAADRFTQRLCDQMDKITDKTNWYWSIR